MRARRSLSSERYATSWVRSCLNAYPAAAVPLWTKDRPRRALASAARNSSSSSPVTRFSSGSVNSVPDDRRGLQDGSFGLCQPVDARRQHRLDRGRQCPLVDLGGGAKGAALALETAALDQLADQLLHEEGVAAHPVRDALGQGRERGVGAEPIAEEGGERPFVERSQTKRRVIEGPEPTGAVLRPKARDQQGGRGGQRLDERLQDRLARRIDPAQLLDHDHARRRLPPAEQQATQRRKEPLVISPRAAEGHRPGFQQLEDERQLTLDRRVEENRPAGHLGPDCPLRIPVGDTEAPTARAPAQAAAAGARRGRWTARPAPRVRACGSARRTRSTAGSCRSPPRPPRPQPGQRPGGRARAPTQASAISRSRPTKRDRPWARETSR